MVFAPVDPAIKEKVLSAYLAGHGRNQITRDMHGLGIKVSHVSISNIINAYKRKHEQPSQSQICPESRTSNAGISTGVGSGTGQAVTTTNNSNSNVVTPRNGAPLSHLLGEDTSTDEEEIISVSVTPYSNSPSPVVPVLTPPKQEPFPEPKSKDLFIKDPDSQDVLEEESEEPVGCLSAEEIDSSKPKVRDTSDSIEEAETSVSVEKSIHDKLEQERIAWDYYGSAWMGILKQIRREKDQRRHELLVIDRRKQKLSEWKKRLEQMQYDLTARESRILESEPFLPLARQLQEMKLALEDALPWIETINEVAQIQTMDIKSAGVLVAQELRLNRQFKPWWYTKTDRDSSSTIENAEYNYNTISATERKSIVSPSRIAK
jgi:hypothetical protein